MYFMPQATTRVYRLCAPIKSIYRYIITIVTLVGVFCLWYFIFYQPIACSIISYKQMMEVATKNGITDAAVQSLKTEYEALEHTLSQYNYSWKQQGLELVLECAAQAGLFFISCDMSKRIIEPWHTQDTVALSFYGSSTNFLDFFSRLDQAGVLYTCKHASMTVHTPKAYLCSCVLHLSVIEQVA